MKFTRVRLAQILIIVAILQFVLSGLTYSTFPEFSNALDISALYTIVLAIVTVALKVGTIAAEFESGPTQEESFGRPTKFDRHPKVANLAAVAVSLALAVLALRYILVEPGLAGFTWDWDAPPFANQIMERASYFFSSWDFTTLGQPVFQYQGATVFYWFSMVPLSLLGADFASKAMPTILMVVSSMSMYYLCRTLKLGFLGSLLGGAFYMLSPVIFSAIAAGHLELLFGMAFIPLFIACLIRSWSDSDGIRRLRFSVIAGVAFALSLSQVGLVPEVMLISIIVVVFGALAYPGRRVGRSYLTAVAIAFSFHASWILPLVLQSVSIGQVSVPLGKFAGGPVSSQLAASLLSHIQAVSATPLNAIRLFANTQTLSTEFAYPIPQIFQGLWPIATLAIPILVFGSAAIPRIGKFRSIPFAAIGLIGVLLDSIGTTPLFSKLQSLSLLNQKISTALLAEYDNPYRFAPIAALSYGVMLACLASYLVSKFMGGGRGKRQASAKVYRTGAAVVLIALVISMTVYTSPFTSGSMSNKVNVSTLYNSFSQANNFLLHDTSDYTVAFLPPEAYSFFNDSGITSPGPDLTVSYSTRPTLTGQVIGFPSSFPRFIAAGFLQANPNSNQYGTILGLSSTKYVLLEGYRTVYGAVVPSSLSFGTATDLSSTSNQAMLREIADQTGLVEVQNASNPTVKIFKNNDFMSRVRLVDNIALVSSDDLTSLLTMSGVPALNFTKVAVVYANQIMQSQFNRTVNSTDTAVFLNNDYLDMAQQVLQNSVVIHPGRYVPKSADPNNGWANADYGYVVLDPHIAGLVNPDDAIFTKNDASSLAIPFAVNETGQFSILAHEHFGLNGSALPFAVDGGPISEAITQANSDRGFVWVKVGAINMTQGTHILTISSRGYNALDTVIIAPKNAIENAMNSIESQVSNKRIILLYDLDKSSEIVRNASFTNGFAIGLPTNETAQIPVGGSYDVSLRIQVVRNSTLSVQIGNNTYTTDVAAESAPYWIPLGILNLAQGNHTVSIQSTPRTGVIADVLNLTKQGRLNQSMATIASVTRVGQTEYRITATGTGNLYIVLSQNYDLGWKASTNNQVLDPLEAYGFADLYIASANGSTPITIQYQAQATTDLGWAVTAASAISVAIALTYCHRRIKKQDSRISKS